MALGLLFLVGSGAKPYRIGVGAICLGLGAVSLGYGVKLFKRANKLLPSYITEEILELARKKNGVVSEQDIMALLGSRWMYARKPLQQMLSGGTCKKKAKNQADYYIFEAMLPRLAIKRCEFCGAELPLDEEITSCPNCGGTVRTEAESISLPRSGVFSMDE